MAIDTYFKNIANAIREKTGGVDRITPSQMPDEIRSIETGSTSPVILSGNSDPTSDLGNDGNLYLKTFGILQPLVTSESELIVTVTANTNWTGYEPWKAFTSTTGWIGHGGNPHWLQIEFPEAASLTNLTFSSFDGNRSHAVTRIGYSNDGETFTDAVLSESTMVNNEGTVVLEGEYQAKYYRLYFDGSYGTQTYPMVGNLNLFGPSSKIANAYVKVNGSWRNLIGADKDDPNSATLVDKTITENGVYRATNDNADGYRRVTVNISE